ncbi:hypothetical protein VTJ83DRAFT_762 [Remersonia thermophila]|uniref:Uncharacterized protein n=1 Tax=Remersonia thermophila TaxID=72144 RepID=A0ABR4DMH9_9PEZI
MPSWLKETIPPEKGASSAIEECTASTTKTVAQGKPPPTPIPPPSFPLYADIDRDGTFFCECPFCVCGEAVIYPGETCFACLKRHS